MNLSHLKIAVPLLFAGAAALNLAGCAGSPTKESTGEYVDDAAITAKVKKAFIQDDQVKAFDIHVETFKGVVQLSGFVDNNDQKLAAERDAQGVPGVTQVRDNVTIK